MDFKQPGREKIYACVPSMAMDSSGDSSIVDIIPTIDELLVKYQI